MHHANLLIGSPEWAESVIPHSDRAVSSDVLIYSFDRMGIADVRALIYASNLAPIERSYRVFRIVASAITHEAQNALLKLFEEPSPTARFYLVVPSASFLLPTLRSRIYPLGLEGAQQGEHVDVKAFFEASHAERLKLIEKRTKDKDDAWVEEIMRGVERYAEETKACELLRDVVLARSYLGSQGASKKMLLEHLSLTLTK